MHFKPFVPNAPFLYPLKTSENLTVFQGLEKGCIGNEWVKEKIKNLFNLNFIPHSFPNLAVYVAYKAVPSLSALQVTLTLKNNYCRPFRFLSFHGFCM